MLKRLTRIRKKFGTGMFLRMLLLIFGLIAMPAFGYLGFVSILPAIVVVAGMALGWLLRRQTVDHFEWFAWALPAALFSYGIILFLGERVLGLTKLSQLVVVTAVTVIVFNIQFWSLSDPSIVNTQR
jgi:hypothetical protein